MDKFVASKTMMLDVSSVADACPATIDGFNPMKPCHERGDQKASKDLAEEYKNDEIDSWLSLNHDSDDEEQNTNGYYCGEVDDCLDVKGYNSCFEHQYRVHYNPQLRHSIHQGNTASEKSLVTLPFLGAPDQEEQEQQWSNFDLGMECEMLKAGFVHDPLKSQSVSVPYMEAGIVPKATVSDISDSFGRNPRGQFGTHSCTTLPMPPNFTCTNREAKVQRYREKRKTRTFEKKIRYASRQAYAETRPRVKGKFAREAEKDERHELDQMSSMDKYPHGIGPSF